MTCPPTPPNEVHTMTLDGVTRREFIKMLGMFTAGAACGLNPLESEASEGDYDFQMPPDRELKQYLNQPVDDTIGTPGVDYVPVKDENYDQIVKGSNKPVMVLFYNSEGQASAGDAALAKVLDQTFEKDGVKEGYAGDDILFCAYQITDGSSNSPDTLFDLQDKYPIEKTPAIAFYEHKNGEIQHKWTLNGGSSDFQEVKEMIGNWTEAIDDYLLN